MSLKDITLRSQKGLAPQTLPKKIFDHTMGADKKMAVADNVRHRGDNVQ